MAVVAVRKPRLRRFLQLLWARLFASTAVSASHSLRGLAWRAAARSRSAGCRRRRGVRAPGRSRTLVTALEFRQRHRAGCLGRRRSARNSRARHQRRLPLRRALPSDGFAQAFKQSFRASPSASRKLADPLARLLALGVDALTELFALSVDCGCRTCSRNKPHLAAQAPERGGDRDADRDRGPNNGPTPWRPCRNPTARSAQRFSQVSTGHDRYSCQPPAASPPSTFRQGGARGRGPLSTECAPARQVLRCEPRQEPRPGHPPPAGPPYPRLRDGAGTGFRRPATSPRCAARIASWAFSKGPRPACRQPRSRPAGPGTVTPNGPSGRSWCRMAKYRMGGCGRQGSSGARCRRQGPRSRTSGEGKQPPSHPKQKKGPKGPTSKQPIGPCAFTPAPPAPSCRAGWLFQVRS